MRNPVFRIIAVRTLQVTVLSVALHWLFHWPFTGRHAIGFFLTPLLCLSFIFTFIAPLSWGLPILTRLSAQCRVVALTFDDGPSAETTPLILDILRQYGVTATFFVLGASVERHREIVKRILEEGHTVGIHAYSHRDLVIARPIALQQEIEETMQVISHIVPGWTPRWFRPPYGFKTFAMPFIVRRMGCRMVTWSGDTHDYRLSDSARIAQNALRKSRPGEILLLHDGPDNLPTAAALPLILEGLRAQNFQCVRL